MTPRPADVWSEHEDKRGALIVVSGAIGAGKTTWCMALVAYARTVGASVAGVISPGVFADERKVAIDLLSLVDDERRRLADRLPVPNLASPTPNWEFRPQTLAWGDEVLQAVGSGDLLMIDELGPLELLHQQGWQFALSLLRHRKYRMARVVVRPSLLTAFLTLFPDAKVIQIERQESS